MIMNNEIIMNVKYKMSMAERQTAKLRTQYEDAEENRIL